MTTNKHKQVKQIITSAKRKKWTKFEKKIEDSKSIQKLFYKTLK